ncbi:hypothetical protein C8Q74DRAFT_1208622 [Fomes fomentarius]|nr:hypothetical protein C8Q74DRAFT_1208622 [Fomes fomentarius]
MKESGTKGKHALLYACGPTLDCRSDVEYFWLGRIPCRTVRLVGVIVGVQVWEKRTVYTIDDGTAVVDCALAHAQVAPASPVKPKSKSATLSKDMTKSTRSSFADYLLSSRKVPLPLSATTNIKSTNAEPPPPPKPAVSVGQIARIVGRVVPRFDARIILVDEISRCASYNDESNHSISVSDLHRTTYYPSEPLPPFIPPVHTSHSSASHHPYAGCLRSPSKRATTQVPQTPASTRSIPASTTTSPSTSVTTSSPSSSTGGEPRVPRLRHPSRLRTRDLSSNTFRIYVKHYMDNAPPPRRKRGSHSRTRSVSPSPTPRLSQARRGDLVATPTKSRRGQVETGVDATPRPAGCLAIERTPRASLASAADSDDESDDEVDATYGQLYGYTLSHLRRVPELSLLARRVVKTEAHCRAKEERKKAKSHKLQLPSTSASSASGSTSRSSPDTPLGPAVKRLFKQAIRTLFSEGEIVLWSGPVRPLPEPVFDPLVPSSLGLWKANTSTSSAATSSSSRSAISYDDWDDDEALSEPTRGEEAYVPLTPAYFSRVLESAIRTIMTQAASLGEGEGGEATPKLKAKSTFSSSSARGNSLIERLRAQEKENAGPPSGPTKEQLLAWLRSSDERWARVGEWTVEEALQWGKREGRLWCVGKGRWEVCG